LQAVIGGAEKVGTKLRVKNIVGVTQFAASKEIIVKPIVTDGSGVDEEWLHIIRAYPKANLEWQYNNADQRVTNVVFKAFPDTQSPVGIMYRMGPATPTP